MNSQKRVHFVGIGGYGMSAIARVLLDLGYQVSGSDVAENALVKNLMERGAKVSIGHSAEHIDGADIVVYSSSISPDNVERVAAKEQGIEVLHRSQMLARLLNDKKGIAVAGAHGKTTTSSMVAQTLELCGVDPTYIIGGEIVALKGNAKAGQSDYVVAEADESDGSFLEYYPHLAVVTNIEADHLENYGGDFENLKKAYRSFLNQVRPDGAAVLFWDDEYVREMADDVNGRIITYAIDRDADYRAINIRENLRQIQFTVVRGEEVLGDVLLNIPGRHNVANALAAVIVCLEVGVPFEQIVKALFRFQGAKRRFQVIGEEQDILIVDDYAHHPTEIQATLKGAKALGRRMVVVFQPQRYSRTHLLMNEFSQAFYDADEVIINTIYAPPGEQPIPGVTAERLAELIKQNSNANTRFLATKEEVVEYLAQHVQPNDLVMTMGAGDIWRVAHMLKEELQKERVNE
ncbi:UDP-N-acetylmuramate--L-alanine ligase [Thermoactinomyces intermedius]|uniref:UDP-N-acetylmuramate--L-alanine ligase n=1 Tax=Thermoactinomyces intermedius TaxID=2024 RepID=A0A8I1DF74_THEIN|nr:MULTISPECIES: UDP-N-acetylmuramate--L-alanine ligase [Thermoactinomyces]MBA4548663.1 UDP-N-acetylmuramate--L-alanine ligase [Thermoactinomyces intermedius]MBA4836737.1 UDP-N-acetylmuramate--L-alanine ligase [Thermoactinomyces intermedius]MBH8594541.1 UDP-N-acetylmuramate--L-alanine ligase [Thermoactinomyces intermedius]MBH8601555.1 UDP-N-acetylmuramate--L-alanine ligase [Thermoactinomyces sp. CICC 23799]